MNISSKKQNKTKKKIRKYCCYPLDFLPLWKTELNLSKCKLLSFLLNFFDY